MNSDNINTTYCLGCRKPMPPLTTFCPLCGHDQRKSAAPREVLAQKVSVLNRPLFESAFWRGISNTTLCWSIVGMFFFFVFGALILTGGKNSTVTGTIQPGESHVAALVQAVDANPDAQTIDLDCARGAGSTSSLNCHVLYYKGLGEVSFQINGVEGFRYSGVTDAHLRQVQSTGERSITGLGEVGCIAHTSNHSLSDMGL